MPQHPIQVPSDIVQTWQEMVDLLAEIMHVPSALIMKVEAPNIKVFVASESKENPWERDEVASLNGGTYCETVMKTRQLLVVPDALQDDEWKSNPDIEVGMISYLGLPISWPDGEIFGTICVLDKKRNEYSEVYRKLMLHCRDVSQAHLRSLVTVHRELEQREAAIQRMFDTNIGIFSWGLDGQILDANDTFLRMLGYDHEDLVSGRIRSTDLTPGEYREQNERSAAALKVAGCPAPFEREYLRKDGRRVPVLIGTKSLEEGRNAGLAWVLDLTERKRAEAEAQESERCCREVKTELIRANDVATMAQLTALIAQEVKQPIAATVSNAQTALRSLERQPPELDEVRQALDYIIKDSNRVGQVIGRIRDFIKTAPRRKDRLDINEAICEDGG